jgi:hypothetical protein
MNLLNKALLFGLVMISGSAFGMFVRVGRAPVPVRPVFARPAIHPAFRIRYAAPAPVVRVRRAVVPAIRVRPALRPVVIQRVMRPANVRIARRPVFVRAAVARPALRPYMLGAQRAGFGFGFGF